MRFLSVCSGMEAASIAFEPLGWKAVGFCEIDPFASAVLAHRFPNTPNYGDLTQHTDPIKWPISAGDVDLIIGGPPCQAFSVAGLRRGLADPRGNLTLTYLSLVDRLRPEWVIYENVPGLLSVDGGRTFGTFLHALGQLGYGWAYRILDAQHVGECRLHPHRRGWSAVPQRRRRIFVVARRGAGGWASAAEVLSLREGVQRHLAAGGKKRQGVAPDAGCGAEEGCLPRTVGTICADSHPGAYTGQDAYTGRLIPASVCATGEQTHCLTASSSKGATEDGTGRGSPIVIDRAAFNQGENAQYDPHIGEADVMDTVISRGPHAVAMRESGPGFWMEDDKAGTLRAEGENRPSRHSHVIGQPLPFRKSKRAQSDTDDESWVEGQQSNTLNNFDVGDTRTTHAVVEPVAIQGTIIGRSENAGPQGTGATEGGPMFTLTKTDIHGVAHIQQLYENHPNDSRVTSPLNVAPTVVSRFGTGGGNVPLVGPMAVRRLTPNECLRLQGFPDNWTNIPWKGKPEGQAPDGPQYKCAGNSFAVPVVRWIGTRIASLTQNETQAQQNNGQ